MSDPFGSPVKSVSRQRSRPNLTMPLPALPSARSLNSIARSPSPPPTAARTINGEHLKSHLASMVDQKASQLQMIGQLGSEILRQQQELNERMKDLDDEGDEELDEGTKRRMRDLEMAVGRWEKDNDVTLREISGKPSGLELEMPTADAPSSTLTRRQRNQQHRALDMDFATEIGQNLLAEVRRLQVLLSERDKAVEKAIEEKESSEAEKDVLLATLRSAESSVERYKEENWNLEVNLQEIRNTYSETTEQLQKINQEQNRLSKSLVSSRELAEMYKTDAEKHSQMVEELRQRHETEMAQARRATAGLQRERSDLLTELNGERQRAISGVRARASRGGSASPAVHVNGREQEDDDDDEDVFGGGALSPRKRPGFDANDQALSPSQLYESDFGTPDPTPSKSDKGYHRSPLGEMYVNEIDELRTNLEKAQAEIDRLKSGAVDEFGVRTGEDEDFGPVSNRGRGSARGRRGRGRAVPASISRKFGSTRTPSGLSAAGDNSFDSGSSATPDLLRTRGTANMDSPLSSSPNLRQIDSLDSLHLTTKAALSDELALGMGMPDSDLPSHDSFDLPSPSEGVPSFMTTRPTDSTISELATPKLSQLPSDIPPSPSAGERTPTKSHAQLPPSRMYETMTRSSSIEDGLTTDTDDAHYTDARSSVGTLTPSQSHADLTDADAHATGQEWHTAAESSAGESSDEDERENRTRTISNLSSFAPGTTNHSWMARRMASREGMNQPRTVEVEKIVERIVEVQVPVDRIVEVPVDRIVEKIVEVPVEVIREVEKRVEVPVEVIREVEKIVEVEKRVEVPVEVIREVEKIVEVEKRVEIPVEVIREVEKIVEVEKRVEVPVEVIREVEKIVEVEKRVEVPVEVIREVEKIVEKRVEVPVEVIREVEKRVEVPVEVIKEVEKIVEVEKRVEVPVEVIREVEKRVEVPVDRIVERIVEVEKRVEVPVPFEVVRTVEVERPVEKIVYVDRDVERTVEVEKPVDRIVYVDRDVERIVEKPVDRIVHVDREVERIVHVDKPVDRVVHVDREVERVVERPVEVEKIVERVVEVPIEVIREVRVEVPVEVIREVEKRVEIPVEVIREVEKIVEVEKRVEVPVEVIREVEKRVEVPVEVIREVEKVVEVEKRVEVPVEVIREVEKRVEVPVEVIREIEVIKEVEKIVEVEKRVEVPVEVIREVEKRVEVPVEVIREVERIVEVEKRVEVPVDVIREVEKIVEVEKRVEVPFEVIREVERIVEVPVDRIVERIVEVPVDRIVEKIVTVPATRSAHNDTSVQTDAIPALGPSLITPAPDLGMFRIAQGTNYDFLKAPPSPATTAQSRRISAETFGRREDEAGLPGSRSVSGASIEGLPIAHTSPDLSRPPVMALPPPPPGPPPAGIAKTMATAPPRPQSPPPNDFVSRSATPGGTLAKKRLSKPAPTSAGSAIRASDMGPPLSISRQTSTSSFRNPEPSTPKADSRAWQKSRETVKKHATHVISTSGRHSATSSFSEAFNRNPSLSSVESVIPPGASKGKQGMGTTDPAVIHAITQTMIGEYLFKYTRRTIGRGQSGNRHQRYFWIHPYTKTLYWGEEDPGSSVASESKAKSVFISSIKVIDDSNPLPPGLHNKSIIVATPGREIQFTAPNKDRHDLWVSALQFLLQQQNGVSPSGDIAQTTVRQSSLSRQPLGPVDEQGRFTQPKTPSAMPKSPMSMRSFRSDNRSLQSMTPKPPRAASSMSQRPPSTLGKRSGTAAYDYWERYTARHAVPDTLRGGHRFAGDYKSSRGRDEYDVVDPQEGDDQDEYEGMDNVRACCDGKHLVGDHKHHHSQRNDRSQTPASQTPSVRAWSIASRRKSTAKPTAASLFGRRDVEGDGTSLNGSSYTAEERAGTVGGRSKSALGFREGSMTPTPAMR